MAFLRGSNHVKHGLWSIGLLACALCTTHAVGSAGRGGDPGQHRSDAVCDAMRLLIELKPARVRVETELTLSGSTRGSEGVDIHAAYGSPGIPLALDAQLVVLTKAQEAGTPAVERIALETFASVRAPGSALSVGSPFMGGRSVRVGHDALSRAWTAGTAVGVLVREVRPLPVMDDDCVREMVVRLGRRGSEPVPLSAIEVKSHEALSLLQAETCGPSGKVVKIRVTIQDVWTGEGEEPSVVQRDVGDDLCIRFRFARDTVEQEREDGGAPRDANADDAS